MKQKISVGDKVHVPEYGDGTVIEISKKLNYAGIELDNPVKHQIDVKTRCVYANMDSLEPVEKQIKKK